MGPKKLLRNESEYDILRLDAGPLLKKAFCAFDGIMRKLKREEIGKRYTPLHLHCLSPELRLERSDCVAGCLETLPPHTSKVRKKRIMKQKLKTHKAMAKRVKVTGSGKFMRRKVAISHLRRHKSPEAIRSADKEFELATGDRRRLKKLLPYDF
jgi:large subunit ribosomal protein L35